MRRKLSEIITMQNDDENKTHDTTVHKDSDDKDQSHDTEKPANDFDDEDPNDKDSDDKDQSHDTEKPANDFDDEDPNDKDSDDKDQSHDTEKPAKDPNDENPNEENPNDEDPNDEDPNKKDPNKEDPNDEDPNKEDPNDEDPNDEDPEDEAPNNDIDESSLDEDGLSRSTKKSSSSSDENPNTKKPTAKNARHRASISREKSLVILEDNYGCEHYKRKSKFVTPCCNKVYTCRFCHDEQEAHTVNRKEVTELICVLCDTRQPVQATCQNCHCQFGKYTCLECNLFDDEDKNQYHCDGCGICRVGGRDKFFHCAKCNMCLPVQLQNGHTCIENVSHSNCPVCLEDIHTSRTPCHIPGCGHLLHRTCFKELLQSGHYACPTCQVSLLDMSDLWKYLDTEVSLTPMPEEYKDYKADILCKDCHEESMVKFHIVGLKCLKCGSYNTCRIKGSPSPVCTDPDALSEAAAGGSNKEEKEES